MTKPKPRTRKMLRIGKPMVRLVHGVGHTDVPTRIGAEPQFKSYQVWQSMLRRCYSSVALHGNPTYLGCSVATEWHSYAAFKRWHVKHYVAGHVLDKDILVPGNKVYGPSTCCYIPQALNKMLTLRTRFRGPYPCGVVCQTFHNKNGTKRHQYKTLLSVDGVRKTVAAFDNPEDAGACYREAKAELVIAQATELYHAREIPRRVLTALKKNIVTQLELADADNRHSRKSRPKSVGKGQRT